MDCVIPYLLCNLWTNFCTIQNVAANQAQCILHKVLDYAGHKQWHLRVCSTQQETTSITLTENAWISPVFGRSCKGNFHRRLEGYFNRMKVACPWQYTWLSICNHLTFWQPPTSYLPANWQPPITTPNAIRQQLHCCVTVPPYWLQRIMDNNGFHPFQSSHPPPAWSIIAWFYCKWLVIPENVKPVFM